MTKPSAHDYMTRAVLDPGFRELALSEPDRAMAEYDLTEEEKSTLRSRDDRILGLLGGASATREPPVETPRQAEVHSSHAERVPRLPPVELLLRVVPQTKSAADGTPQVSYAASLHPWPLPPDGEERGHGNESGEESSEGGAPAEVTWLIRLLPTVVQSEASGLRVVYLASILPIEVARTQPTGTQPGRAVPSLRSPWRHNVESPKVEEAVRDVLASPKDERHRELLALIQLMQTGGERG